MLTPTQVGALTLDAPIPKTFCPPDARYSSL